MRSRYAEPLFTVKWTCTCVTRIDGIVWRLRERPSYRGWQWGKARQRKSLDNVFC